MNQASTPFSFQIAPKKISRASSIQRYTLEHHGRAQVLKYSSEIKEAFEKLRLNPHIGHHRSDIPYEYRAWNVGKHAIIYRTDHHAAYVVAILHGRMNFTEQL